MCGRAECVPGLSLSSSLPLLGSPWSGGHCHGPLTVLPLHALPQAQTLHHSSGLPTQAATQAGFHLVTVSATAPAPHRH